MAERKPFLLRLDRDLHAALEHWAADELRSLNAQLEYLLRRALRESGRQLRGAATASAEQHGPADSRADRERKS